MDKISVMDFINDNSLLEVNYIPFDQKLLTVSMMLNNFIDNGTIENSSIIRRISTEIFIETISNIDLTIKDENGLEGYDQLYYNNEMDLLKQLLGFEYVEFENILNERISDYYRTESNSAFAIRYIYDRIVDILGSLNGNATNDDNKDYISEGDNES